MSSNILITSGQKIAVVNSTDEPPTGSEMTALVDWRTPARGTRVAGISLLSSEAGGATFTNGKVWVSHSGIQGGAALLVGPLDTPIALSTVKGYFAPLFDLGGWEKVGVSGTPSAGTVTIEIFPFEVEE